MRDEIWLFQSACAVADDYIIDLGASAKLVLKFFFRFFNESAVQFVFNQIDSTSTETAAHYA